MTLKKLVAIKKITKEIEHRGVVSIVWKSIDETLAGNQDTIVVLGRVKSVRKHKNRVFIDLVDYSSHVQLVIEKAQNTEIFERASKQRPGAYISAEGKRESGVNKTQELRVKSLEVLGISTLLVEPPWSFNGALAQHGEKVFSIPEIYVANPQRAAILKIKMDFISSLHRYFQNNCFTLVEPPILTDKTLYGADTAITAEVHGEQVFLSQCATFELEPLAMVFGKVYTISPAFRNEKAGSKRHLAEYTHAKAEVLLATIDDLMKLASDAIHHAITDIIKERHNEMRLLGATINLDLLDYNRHEHLTYDSAIKLVNSKGSNTTWGKNLTRDDEKIITHHLEDKYVWVHFPPFALEGFPYRRLPSDSRLSMTCDLIAPNGAGEMVGVAEKVTDPEELIRNLIEKGQKKRIKDFWNYIALREYGMPPHGGLGAAPERILYGLLGLNHIRLTKPWPRYPDRRITQVDKNLNSFGSISLQRLIKKYDLEH